MCSLDICDHLDTGAKLQCPDSESNAGPRHTGGVKQDVLTFRPSLHVFVCFLIVLPVSNSLLELVKLSMDM